MSRLKPHDSTETETKTRGTKGKAKKTEEFYQVNILYMVLYSN